MIRDANKEDIPAIQLIARLSIDVAYEELFREDVREFAIDNYYSNEMMETLFDKGFVLLVRNEEKDNVGFLRIQNSLRPSIKPSLLPHPEHLQSQ